MKWQIFDKESHYSVIRAQLNKTISASYGKNK